MNEIDFSQMHCGRDAVIELMAEYIDLAAEHGAAQIGAFALVRSNLFVAGCGFGEAQIKPFTKDIKTEFVICNGELFKGIDTPADLKQILSQWGYL